VTEQELDLFHLATSEMAHPRAAATKVMGCKSVDSSPLRRIPYHVQITFWVNPLPKALHSCGWVGTAVSPDSCGAAPIVNRGLDPVWDGNRSDVTALSDQIHHRPMVFPLLKVSYLQRGQFRSKKRAFVVSPQ
jgi:hypothetical protein